jgi:hypothetical protein
MSTRRSYIRSATRIAGTATTEKIRGKVVYVKAEALYIFDLAYLGEPGKGVLCPFDLAGASPDVPQLWLMRSSDLRACNKTLFVNCVQPNGNGQLVYDSSTEYPGGTVQG